MASDHPRAPRRASRMKERGFLEAAASTLLEGRVLLALGETLQVHTGQTMPHLGDLEIGLSFERGGDKSTYRFETAQIELPIPALSTDGDLMNATRDALDKLVRLVVPHSVRRRSIPKPITVAFRIEAGGQAGGLSLGSDTFRTEPGVPVSYAFSVPALLRSVEITVDTPSNPLDGALPIRVRERLDALVDAAAQGDETAISVLRDALLEDGEVDRWIVRCARDFAKSPASE